MEASITLESIYEELSKIKGEILNTVKASEARLLMSITALNARVHELDEDNRRLRAEVEELKRRERKNCVVVFGHAIERKALTLESICGWLKALLGIQVEYRDISDFYTLGRKESSPLKIEFATYWLKQKVLKSCRNLKGTGVVITADLTEMQREEYKILRRHLLLAKQDTRNECFIKRDRLVINGEAYNVAELERRQIEMSYREEARPSSCPATPKTSKTDTVSDTVNRGVPSQVQSKLVEAKTDKTDGTDADRTTGVQSRREPKKPFTRSDSISTRKLAARVWINTLEISMLTRLPLIHWTLLMNVVRC
ncbi:uncharacterized protein LOC123310727 [Coccinella septempunctata]|uniref:uncharacterized protein LOC123310727 n=1 Tax=Coccinella septempunctata TaxID=41139 RepID=UPI001D068111|nr:uncharacterized protein LOC123310727 [Coccinella septempunctata]